MGDTKVFYGHAANSIAAYLRQELSINVGVHYSVHSATNGPRVLTLNLVVNPTYAKRIIGMAEPLSMAVGLDKDASIRIARGHWGTLALEIPKPKTLWFNIRVSSLPRRRGLRTVCGIDGEHRPTDVDFGSPLLSHTLIAGTTGCGKTNLERLLAFQLAMQNQPTEVKFLLFDVADAGLAWDGFGHLPHLVHGVIGDVHTALSALDWLQGEMARRAEERCHSPRLFVFVDEIQELAQNPQFVRPVEALAKRGRKWGINLVLATQRPTKDSTGSMDIMANLGLRMVGKVTSGREAAWATGLSESGAQKLLGPGDMLLVKPGGIILRMATPLLTDEDIVKLPRDGHERISFPEPAEADEGGQVSDFDALETVISLLAAHHGKGRPWLKDALEEEGRGRPGSPRARRLLAWGKGINDLLRRYGYRLALTG